MPRLTAKNLLETDCCDLCKLLEVLIALAKDRGYLSGRMGFENTISEIDVLLAALKNRIIQIAQPN